MLLTVSAPQVCRNKTQTYLRDGSQFSALAEALEQLLIIHHQRTLQVSSSTTSISGKYPAVSIFAHISLHYADTARLRVLLCAVQPDECSACVMVCSEVLCIAQLCCAVLCPELYLIGAALYCDAWKICS